LTKLEAFLAEYDLVAGALLSTEGSVNAQAGEFSDWASNLCGPSALLLWDGAIRPAMAGEGREFALLERVACGWALVFGRDRAEGMEHILFARQVGSALQGAWGAA
jgi:hypothetical protein